MCLDVSAVVAVSEQTAVELTGPGRYKQNRVNHIHSRW